MARLVAITGGIGSGKSVVSSILKVMGYKVYDCDLRAKLLMDSSELIKNNLVAAFGKDVLIDRQINRAALSGMVFQDKEKLNTLNRIVHPVVKQDVKNWVAANEKDSLLFIETAILKESNLNDVIDIVLLVDSPIELRISRVMARNNMTQEAVMNRINSQQDSNQAGDIIINNNEKDSLINQILLFLNHHNI